jgi:hypothetical protein
MASLLTRRVDPELLDSLPPDNPRAIRSRRDLKRVNAAMRQARIFANLVRDLPRPQRILELGSGDGTFLLSVAPLLQSWRGVRVYLLDQAPVVSSETLQRLEAAGWHAEILKEDAFVFLAQNKGPRFDLISANLFLHHFHDESLRELLGRAAAATKAFAACEPERSALALSGAHMLWGLACNDVTRYDAVVSVRAGFRGRELSGLWPASTEWSPYESKSLFTHKFLTRWRAA